MSPPAATHVLLIAVWSGLLAVLICAGETPPALGEESVRSWIAPDREQLAAQREKIGKAADQLNRLLESDPQGPPWRDYLLWPSLQESISDEVDESQELQLDALADLWSVYNRLTDDHPGLERSQFQELRQSIRTRIRQLNAITTRRGSNEAAARRKRLETLLAEDKWTGQAQSEWSQHIRWLDDRMQPLPEADFGKVQPNLCVRLSASFIRRATMTAVADPTDVNECIVGTRVIGNGVTRGQGWLSPANSTQGARLIARFQGVLDSDTIGYNGPVRVYSDGHTRLTGSASLQLTKDGLQFVGSEVDAAATSRTKGVATKFRGIIDGMVRRVARRQIAKKQAQADWESSWKARESFRVKFAEDIEEQVREGDGDFQNELRLPLLRRDLMPPTWTWSSRPTDLETIARFDGRQRPSSSTPAPTIPDGGAVHVVVHQSLVDNVLEGYFAGRLLALDGPVPEVIDSQSSVTSDVAIRLDDFQPLRCVFDHNEVELNLLGRQYIARGAEYPAAMIQVKYRFEATPEGIILVRVGRPIVSPTPRFARAPRFGIGGAAVRTAIQPSLPWILPEEVDVILPDIDAELPDAVRSLRFVQASTDSGWLHLALDMTLD